MQSRRLGLATLVAIALVLAVPLANPQPAEGSIHEIIAAMCRAGGEEVQPPGINRPDSHSFLASLIATGFITGIDTSDPTEVVIHFDPTIAASKFMSAGFDLRIPNGAGPGVDLVLSPFVIPDPNFPAHANCANLR